MTVTSYMDMLGVCMWVFSTHNMSTVAGEHEHLIGGA